MVKKIILFLIVPFFFINSLQSVTVNGNNAIWSTEEDEEFLYSVIGKNTGKKIWKIYNIKKSTAITLFYDTGIIPVWSNDGKIIATSQKDKLIVYKGPTNTKSFNLATTEIVDMNFSYDNSKIVYSDGSKIYLMELANGENSFLGDGSKPFFMNNDKSIIYFDEEFHISTYKSNLKSDVITREFIKTVLPFKNENKYIFQDNDLKKIKLMDINLFKTVNVVEEYDEITDFAISQDNKFIVYVVNGRDLYIAHIPTRLKVNVLSDSSIYTPKLSKFLKYCSYEKNEIIYIKEIDKYIDAFKLDKIFRVNIGFKQGVTMGMSLEAYEERKNPFTGQVIGMDNNKFKGLLKVITVYDDYCYCQVDESVQSGNKIEVNDIAYWKEKDITAVITK